MFLKLHELIILLVIGALLLIIVTAALVRDYLAVNDYRYPGGGRLPSLLTATAHSLAEIPEELHRLATSFSSFELQDRFPEQSGFIGEANKEELYLLLNRYDGDIEKSVVELIDLRSFLVLHRWVPEFPTGDSEAELALQSFETIRALYSDDLAQQPTHSSLLTEGSLIFGRDGSISKINACSHPQWRTSLADSVPTNASLEQDGSGNIWITTTEKRTPTQLGDVGPGERVSATSLYHDSYIVQLSPSGEEVFSKSITDILVENELSHFIFAFNKLPAPDPFHLADIQPALTDGTHWKRDDVLISLKYLSMVLLYRPSTDQLLWHSIGRTYFQSDVAFTGDSNILIFDNNTPAYLAANAMHHAQKDQRFKMVNGHSKILFYDFTTDQYSHYLDDALGTHEVKTAVRGRSQILPNGDLFVEETEHGRLLYFNADASLLWSHVNRARDNKVYTMGSSRILHRDHDLAMVRDFLTQKDALLAQCKQ